ncbi:nucleotidyltransferase family protein [Paucibacter soli]|uniref:nucleotidyltransferase family protein n=1 Tax=Paucibacter soli TaxID=3133433 RepID=UPI0030B2DAA4
MQTTRTPDPQARLLALVRDSAWMMDALRAVRSLDLPNWCIGAGALRNLVWDALHGKSMPSALADIDVAYFDAGCLASERDAELQSRLCAMRPGLPWEVTNQAGVHLWFEACFGHAVAPLRSLEEAVASWPEYATAVGVRLDWDDSLTVIAPHGLHDLFACVVRRNPLRVSLETYRQRLAQKRYAERWPSVRVLDEPARAGA